MTLPHSSSRARTWNIPKLRSAVRLLHIEQHQRHKVQHLAVLLDAKTDHAHRLTMMQWKFWTDFIAAPTHDVPGSHSTNYSRLDFPHIKPREDWTLCKHLYKNQIVQILPCTRKLDWYLLFLDPFMQNVVSVFSGERVAPVSQHCPRFPIFQKRTVILTRLLLIIIITASSSFHSWRDITCSPIAKQKRTYDGVMHYDKQHESRKRFFWDKLNKPTVYEQFR